MCTYDLKYDDYSTNITNGLQSILATSDISDVTLAVEGKFFKVHQVILSIFSPYFRELFTISPSRHAIFFMKNVKYRIMKDLLAFMYEGNVQILSEDLQLFMETAHELKIKGLTDEETANGARPRTQPSEAVRKFQEPPRKASNEPAKKTMNDALRRSMPEPLRKPVLQREHGIKEEPGIQYIQNNVEDIEKLAVTKFQQNKRQADSTQHIGIKKSKPVPKIPVQITPEVTALPVVASTSYKDEKPLEPIANQMQMQLYEHDSNADNIDIHANMFEMNFSEMSCSMDEDVIELDDEMNHVYTGPEEYKGVIPGDPVMVKMVRTKKGLALYANNYQYHRGDNSTYWTTWRCVRRISPQGCTAILVLSRDGRAALKSSHNHAPCSADMEIIGALAIQEHAYQNTTMEILNNWRLGMKRT